MHACLREPPGIPSARRGRVDRDGRGVQEGRGIDSLPSPIRSYLSRIEEITGVPVVSVGVGPDRLAS